MNLHYQYLALEYADRQNVPKVTSYEELLTHPSTVIATTTRTASGVVVCGQEITLPIEDVGAIVTPNAVAVWYADNVTDTDRYGLTIYHIDSIERAFDGNAYAHATVWGVLTWFVTEGGSLGTFLWDRTTPKPLAIDRTAVPWLSQYPSGINAKSFVYPTSNALDLAVLVTLKGNLSNLGTTTQNQAGYPVSVSVTPSLNQAPTNPVSYLLAADSDTTVGQETRPILYGANAMKALSALQEFITSWVRNKDGYTPPAGQTPYIDGLDFDTVTRVQLVPRFMVEQMTRLTGSQCLHQRFVGATTYYTAVPVLNMRHADIATFDEDDLPKPNAVHRATRYHGVTFTVRQFGEEICSWTPIERTSATVSVGGSVVNGLNAYIAVSTQNQPTLYAPINLPEQPNIALALTSWWKANGEATEAANQSANTAAVVGLIGEVAALSALTAVSGGAALGVIATAASAVGGISNIATEYGERKRTTRALKNKTVANDGTIGTYNTATLFNDPAREWLSVEMVSYNQAAYDELDAFYALYGSDIQTRDNPKNRDSNYPFYYRGYASVRFLTTVDGFPFVCPPAVVSAEIANEYNNGVVHWSGRVGLL